MAVRDHSLFIPWGGVGDSYVKYKNLAALPPLMISMLKTPIKHWKVCNPPPHLYEWFNTVKNTV
jgi:hypothetical protein